MQDISAEFIGELYTKYRTALALARKEQRALRAVDGFVTQLDDIEAEITYLLLREYQPDTVLEIGSLHGWSTTWMLRALRDNGRGHLHTHDLIDSARRAVPAELADRWTFVVGDVRETLRVPPARVDHLYLDAAHNRRFARWYIDNLLSGLVPGTPVSVHDVFHGRRPLPFSEGAVLLKWLRNKGISYFTPSPAAAPSVHASLCQLKQELGLAEPVHSGRDNPMAFFTVQ